MKHTILTIILLLFISMNYSFAVDEHRIDNTNQYENPKSFKNDKVNSEKEQMQFKRFALKRKVVKRVHKKSKKFFNSNDQFMPHKINALVIIGFLIFLPGMILTLIGIALIPALVLVIVGGTLWVIGLIKMMKS